MKLGLADMVLSVRADGAGHMTGRWLMADGGHVHPDRAMDDRTGETTA